MVTHNYPRFAGDVAGAFVARLVAGLAARGHAMTVVAPADRGDARRHVSGNVEVVQVRYARPERETLAYTGRMAEAVRSPGGALAFRALLRALSESARAECARSGARLLHAHWWIPAGWAATRTGLPTVVTVHGTDVELLRYRALRWFGRRVLRRARAVTAVSHFLADRLATHVGRSDVDVIPLPLDTQAYVPGPRGGAGIAVLGRLSAQKRVDLVLRAVHAAGLRVPMTIIGDGPARAGLERLATDLGLAQVQFLGAVPTHRVPTVLRDADVLAFAARREGLGLAAAEALLLGVPVVACTDGGGVLDLVRDGAGGHVAAPEPGALGAALRNVLTDGGARERAARAGAELRERISPEATAIAFEQVYARVA